MSDSVTDAFCPKCEPLFRRSKPTEQVGVRLERFETNYSGTGCDLGHCPDCEKIFIVSYKIDTVEPFITEIPKD